MCRNSHVCASHLRTANEGRTLLSSVRWDNRHLARWSAAPKLGKQDLLRQLRAAQLSFHLSTALSLRPLYCRHSRLYHADSITLPLLNHCLSQKIPLVSCQRANLQELHPYSRNLNKPYQESTIHIGKHTVYPRPQGLIENPTTFLLCHKAQRSTWKFQQ